MAAQTILILIDHRSKNRDTIQSADPADARLRWTQHGRRGELRRLIGGVSIVAIDARGMTVVVQQHCFGSIVDVVPGWQGMAGLRNLGHNVERRGRQVGAPVVTRHAILRNRIISRRRRRGRAQQPCWRNCIVRHMTGRACIHSDRLIRTDVTIR